ncbi:MAG: PaaI family thioesterase [Rubrivivax sp.]|jgi:uncharacterized protein (TIGR00369 family)|nr:PaaI family thioesterase [Rubrivivax sp.]
MSSPTPMPFAVHIPFVELLGFELLEFEAGRAQVAMTLRDEHTNSWGVAHGGLLMTLLDVAMAHAARSPLQPGGRPFPGVVTIEMKSSFMKPGQGRLVAHGALLQRTATLAFTEGRVIDDEGTLVTHATGTFKYLHGLPTGKNGQRIQKLNASD